MLTSIQHLNTSLLSFASDTFESGVAELIEVKESVSALFHEDTEEFFVDYDLICSNSL